MEWQVKKIDFSRTKYDFENSGQKNRVLTQLVVEDYVLFNMLERTRFNDHNNAQVILCEQCGIGHCEPGGWLAPRRWKKRVIMIPVPTNSTMKELDRCEYAAPNYVGKQGFPSFTAQGWERICSISGGLLSFDEIPQLSNKELILTIQYFAPGNVLGEQGCELKIDANNVVASNTGDLHDEILTFAQLVKDSLSSDESVIYPTLERKVEFYLEIGGHLSWSPFGYSGGKPVLNPQCVLCE